MSVYLTLTLGSLEKTLWIVFSCF